MSVAARAPASWPRLLLWPGLLILFGFAVLVGLGTWQVERLHWKLGLIAEVTTRTNLKPVPLPAPADWKNLDLAQWDYRPVTLRGHFRHDLEVRVYTYLGEPKGKLGGAGYWVMTPLVLDGGGTVIVNRGFVPLNRADPAARAAGQVPGEVTVTGLLRLPQDRNFFTPADEPAKHLFFTRDPKAIAADYHIAGAAPFTVDANAAPNPGGLPQGGETTVDFPNNHLQYAITWYGLAAILVGCTIVLAVKRRHTTPLASP
jgi:surfeit locus 1 family protein